MTTFAEGLGRGVRVGNELYGTWREQRRDKATRRAMELLSLGQNYDPRAEAFNPASQGVPAEGQPAATVPRSGSGEEFANIGKQYFDAIGTFADIEDYANATAAWGAVKQKHIDDYGRKALAAIDRGDQVGAEEMLRLASTFLNPGYSTEVSTDHETGNFLIAGYDKEGNPHSGGMLTRENIADILQMNSGPEGIEAWADDQAAENRHQDQLGYNYAVFNADQNWKRLAEVRAQSAEERAAIQAEATLANSNLQFMIDNLALTEAQKAAIAKQTDAVMGKITQLATFDKTAAEELEAKSGGFSGPTDKVLIDQESGGRWDAGQGTDYRGRIQWGRARFADAVNAGVIPPGMTWEEFTSGSPESIKAQINGEAWHWSDIDQFIKDNGLDSKLGQRDVHGTTITWAGLRFAAHITGKDNMKDYVLTGEEYRDKNKKGPAEYMKMGTRATPVGPDTAPPPGEEGAIPEAELIISADGTTKKPPHEAALDPWWYEEPNANGEVFERKGLRAGMALAANDIKENNPGVTDDQVAGIVYDAFGAKPRSRLIMAEEGSGEPDYISDGVSKLVLSPNVADVMNGFNTANEQARARFEADRNPQPYETYDQNAPVEAAIPMPTPAAPAAAAPAAPGAAAAAAPPAPPAGAIPEPTAGPPTATPAVDDTAVRMPVGDPRSRELAVPAIPLAPFNPQPAGQMPGGTPPAPLPATIANIKPLAQAVQAWIDAGAQPGGPEQAAVAQIIQRLPPKMQQVVQQELATLGQRQ